MIVKAKRAGWSEELTPEQEFDLEPAEHDDWDLEGELERITFTLPGGEEGELVLVDGQEADPTTIREVK